jgi:cobyrinic acid a,c-diamide synthase
MFDQVHTPRIVVAGTQSGAGKTTVAAGLVAAFRQRGLTVQTFKVGPDYVDAAYLAHVSGRPCRNLDAWMLGEGAIRQIFAQGCLGADLAIVEGCLGLFDGRVDGGPEGSTAEVARVLKALVLLVVDVKGMGHSAAATVLGFKQLEPKTKFAGVILNNVHSEEHQRAVEDAIWTFAKLPVLGALPVMDEVAIPERGPVLLPLRENRSWQVAQERLTQAIAGHVDLNLVRALAARAELLPMVPKKVFPGRAPGGAATRVAVAYDDAFNFYYPENLEMLAEYGGEVVPFSPLEDEQLPDGVEGIYLGGGFPAVFAARLSQNRGMALALQRAHGGGIPIYAEGGGLMYLAREVRTNDQARYAMAGVLPIEVEMEDALRRVGYRQVMTLEDSVLSPRGQFFRGHEFHWSRVLPANGRLRPAYRLANAAGELIGPEGLVAPNLLASYVQLHFGQNPILVERFLQRCRETARARLAV